MTVPDKTTRPVLPANMTAADAAQLERLAEEFSSQVAAAVVYGESVTTQGITVIPVAEVGFGFGFGGGAGGPEHVAGAAGARGVPGAAGVAGTGEGREGVGGGGVRAQARGFIEIKNGTVTYRPLRNRWLDVGVPLAAFLAGTVVPRLARRLAKRRQG